MSNDEPIDPGSEEIHLSLDAGLAFDACKLLLENEGLPCDTHHVQWLLQSIGVVRQLHMAGLVVATNQATDPSPLSWPTVGTQLCELLTQVEEYRDLVKGDTSADEFAAIEDLRQRAITKLASPAIIDVRQFVAEIEAIIERGSL